MNSSSAPAIPQAETTIRSLPKVSSSIFLSV
jgi:hypothetical protein